MPPVNGTTPELIAARKRVAEVARRHGKFAGTVGGPGNANELIAMGYQFISMGADVVGIKNYCQDLVSAFTKSSAAGSKNSYMNT